MIGAMAGGRRPIPTAAPASRQRAPHEPPAETDATTAATSKTIAAPITGKAPGIWTFWK